LPELVCNFEVAINQNYKLKKNKIKMKTRTKLGTALLFMALVSVTTAQNDTVTVVREREVIHDTVVKQNPNPSPDHYYYSDKLHRGELGIRYMPTFVNMQFRNSNGDVVQGDVTVANGIGVMMGTNFSKHVGIQAAVDYLAVSQKYKDMGLSRQVDVKYLNIPVLLSLNTDKSKPLNVNFVVGPQFGVNLGANTSTGGNGDTETLHATVGAKGTDIGAAYGAGLEIAVDRARCFRIDLGYRGFYGLVDGSANQTSANTYNVFVKGSRKTNAAYVGLAWAF
jgi:hypothetical protein